MMKRKFKVGDKVKLKEYYASFKAGTIAKIEIFNEEEDLVYASANEYSDLVCFPRRLELVEDRPIYTETTGKILQAREDELRKILTLPTDSEARKQIPMFSGCIKYFPAAIAGVAKISKAGNDKHNPGQELHHDRNKSLDHADCIIRHLTDVADLIAALERGENTNPEQILAEVSSLAWRALAYSQTLHEKYDGAPLAPGAK